MKNEIHETLYHYNEEGQEGYDLKEVQLLENINEQRVEKLKLLLQNDDRYIAYQAMLILLAWAEPDGFKQLDRFIFEKWDEKETFEPHRIHGEDNVFDIITNALYIAALNGKPEQELYPYIKHFLKIYGTQFFESNLKEFLLKKNCIPFLNEIHHAMQSALENKDTIRQVSFFP